MTNNQHTTFKASAKRIMCPHAELPVSDVMRWEVCLQHDDLPAARSIEILSPAFHQGSTEEEISAIQYLRYLIDSEARKRAFTLQTGNELTSCGVGGCFGIYRFTHHGDVVRCESERCIEIERLMERWVCSNPAPYSVVFDATDALPDPTI